MKSTTVIAALIVAAVPFLIAGCKEKSKSEQVVESSKHGVQAIGESMKDAANQAGKAVENTAEKAWEGLKKGAQEVGHVTTNVAGEVKTGVEKAGEKVKDLAK